MHVHVRTIVWLRLLNRPNWESYHKLDWIGIVSLSRQTKDTSVKEALLADSTKGETGVHVS